MSELACASSTALLKDKEPQPCGRTDHTAQKGFKTRVVALSITLKTIHHVYTASPRNFYASVIFVPIRLNAANDNRVVLRYL